MVPSQGKAPIVSENNELWYIPGILAGNHQTSSITPPGAAYDEQQATKLFQQPLLKASCTCES